MKLKKTEEIVITALAIALYIEQNSGVTAYTIVDEFNVSKPTVSRHLRLLRNLGVQITWANGPNEYTLTDWGIFNAQQVRNYFLKKGASLATP